MAPGPRRQSDSPKDRAVPDFTQLGSRLPRSPGTPQAGTGPPAFCLHLRAGWAFRATSRLLYQPHSLTADQALSQLGFCGVGSRVGWGEGHPRSFIPSSEPNPSKAWAASQLQETRKTKAEKNRTDVLIKVAQA